MSQSLTVNLGARSYPIHIGAHLLEDTSLWDTLVQNRQVVVVTNEIVGPLYLQSLRKGLGDREVIDITLPDGEAHKTVETWYEIFQTLLARRVGRDGILIALGGGVVGDIAGFAAATYQRGIDFIQVPTTLLAQVDSSVGGKTGINHALGKNMIGAFYQPKAVIADMHTLHTLDQRQFCAGLGEVIKYGFIHDVAFLRWLESNMPAIHAREHDVLVKMIERSCAIKAEIVGADEKESGQRALLNLGHTFGHAIETGCGYGTYLHGEAVGIGMVLAADLSYRSGMINQADYERVVRLVEAAGLPTKVPTEMTVERFIDLMSVDKKVQHKQLRLVLLKALGEAVVTGDFSQALLVETLSAH